MNSERILLKTKCKALGLRAYENGKRCLPLLDDNFRKYLDPYNKALNMILLKSWVKGYNSEQLRYLYKDSYKLSLKRI
jgi:hypothetical protein